jgi:hypothetical protein
LPHHTPRFGYRRERLEQADCIESAGTHNFNVAPNHPPAGLIYIKLLRFRGGLRDI